MSALYSLQLIEVGNALQNYIYLLHCQTTHTTAAIDPTQAAPVLSALEQRGWTLDLILTTHHHADHTDGNVQLKAATGCRIIGSANDATRIPAIDIGLAEGEACIVGALRGTVLETSGHTIGHICYYFPEIALLFSGDCLFSMGCGRVFEGSYAQAHASLQQLATLPDETMLCPAHEYTLANAAFALTLEPQNADLIARTAHAKKLREAGQPTVPVSLETEKRTNPFLRCNNATIRDHVNMKDATDAEIFTRLRMMKDTF